MQKMKGWKLNMKIKNLLVAVLAAVLCCTTSVTVYAAVREHDTVSPQYVIAETASAKIIISGTTAVCTGNLKSAYGGASAEMFLQTKSNSGTWSNVYNAKWSKTTNSKTLTVSGTKDGLASGTYRAKAVFTLSTNDGRSETITVYSEEKTIV